ncbi:Rrf2 family transcriptional regulator [Rosenbergiella nectarea]|uniref:Rrf2 family transcriptional regulator n=1 Tax=Rosenbergiella nectarea TaxID=988801 RepID=UPI001F4ED6E1|nr:Rrf2 family transcriptional regulator [Rosenbergiella nectarea]
MKVSIERNGEIIWFRNDKNQTGMTSTAYLKDGTQEEIVSALKMALNQAKGEAGITECL